MKIVEQVRKSTRWTQKEIANRLNLQQGNYNKMEKGKLIQNNQKIIEIQALDIMIPDLRKLIAQKQKELNYLIALEQNAYHIILEIE